jgi:hypothetical protein
VRSTEHDAIHLHFDISANTLEIRMVQSLKCIRYAVECTKSFMFLINYLMLNIIVKALTFATLCVFFRYCKYDQQHVTLYTCCSILVLIRAVQSPKYIVWGAIKRNNNNIAIVIYLNYLFTRNSSFIKLLMNRYNYCRFKKSIYKSLLINLDLRWQPKLVHTALSDLRSRAIALFHNSRPPSVYRE